MGGEKREEPPPTAAPNAARQRRRKGPRHETETFHPRGGPVGGAVRRRVRAVGAELLGATRAGGVLLRASRRHAVEIGNRTRASEADRRRSLAEPGAASTPAFLRRPRHRRPRSAHRVRAQRATDWEFAPFAYGGYGFCTIDLRANGDSV